jgi:hypothetical protein
MTCASLADSGFMPSSSRAVSGFEGSAERTATAVREERRGGGMSPGAVGAVCVGAVAAGGVEPAVFGDGAAVLGEGAAVFGEGAAVSGEGAAVFGVGAAVFGEGAAVFGDGVAPGVELAGADEGACCASAALDAASNVTVASNPAAIHADLRCWFIGLGWRIGLASGSSGADMPQSACPPGRRESAVSSPARRPAAGAA